MRRDHREDVVAPQEETVGVHERREQRQMHMAFGLIAKHDRFGLGERHEDDDSVPHDLVTGFRC